MPLTIENVRKSDERLFQAEGGLRQLEQRLIRKDIRVNNMQRLDVYDLLSDYAKKDDTISQARLNAMFRELDDLQTEFADELNGSIRQSVDRSAMFGISAGSAAMFLALGFGLADEQKARIKAPIVRDIFGSVGPDNLTLSNRVWNVTADQKEAMRRVLQRGTQAGTSIGSMQRQIKAVYDNDNWKVERLVRTEANKAARMGVRMTGQRNDAVRALRMHRGKADRPEHRCTEMELEDRYGLGAGIYTLDDVETDNPHINCTGMTTYVYIDENGEVVG